jgi:hypothetical protein
MNILCDLSASSKAGGETLLNYLTNSEHSIMKNYQRHLFLSLLSILLISAAASAQQWFRVKWVIDGDTIVLDDGRHVRYIGINAPEIAHDAHFIGSKQKPRKAEPFGDAAKKYNQFLRPSEAVFLNSEFGVQCSAMGCNRMCA